MPGQGKRRRGRQTEARRDAARFAPDAGEWKVLFETGDEQEFRDHVRRLQEARDPRLDVRALRIDTLCGRLTQPTTYRLSLFVPKRSGPPTMIE
ncbi:hypothetical protein ACIRP0_07315 [Streptomyces sp. NPDC101733]|uniref:hypothetical protein n=1 Tax=unclassified Streptomyces TaxID=2593676 RepID=UPI00380CFCAB